MLIENIVRRYCTTLKGSNVYALVRGTRNSSLINETGYLKTLNHLFRFHRILPMNKNNQNNPWRDSTYR
jgi:hypothetical protein